VYSQKKRRKANERRIRKYYDDQVRMEMQKPTIRAPARQYYPMEQSEDWQDIEPENDNIDESASADKLLKAQRRRKSRMDASKQHDEAFRKFVAKPSYAEAFVSSYTSKSSNCCFTDCHAVPTCFCAECCSCIESGPDLLWCQAHIIEHHQKSSLPHVLCKVKDVNFNGSRVKTCGEVETIDYTLEIVGNVKFPSCSYDDARGDMTVQCWTMYGPISVRLDAPVCTCHRSNVSVNSNEQSLMMSFLAHKILVVMDNSDVGFSFGCFNKLKRTEEFAPYNDYAWLKLIYKNAKNIMTPANFEQLLSKDKLYLLLKEAGCLYSYLHNQVAHVYFAQGVDSGESLAMSPILDAVVKTVCNACPKNSDQGVARYSIDGCFSLKQIWRDF